MNPLVYLALVFLCYLCGSISFSILVGKLRGVNDIRTEGSGNAGATNAFRVLGPKWGLLVVLLDMLKAAMPLKLIEYFVLIPRSPWLIPLIAALLVGHLFPVFHKFKGGKGVAVLAGSLTALFPLLGLCAFCLMLVIILIWKMVSLAALVVAFLLPIGYTVLYPNGENLYIAFFIGIGVLICLTHRKNFGRIIRGQEKKLTFGRKK